MSFKVYNEVRSMDRKILNPLYFSVGLLSALCVHLSRHAVVNSMNADQRLCLIERRATWPQHQEATPLEKSSQCRTSLMWSMLYLASSDKLKYILSILIWKTHHTSDFTFKQIFNAFEVISIIQLIIQ